MMSEQQVAQVLRPGVCVVGVEAEPLCGGQVGVRAELSDGSFLQLTRTEEDLARMMKRLVDSFPEDREKLSDHLLTGLLRIQTADQSFDTQTKAEEVKKLLRTIIHLPHKFSQSEAVLGFFAPSAVDCTITQEEDQDSRQVEDQDSRQVEDQDFRQIEDQDSRQVEDQDFTSGRSIILSEVMMSNGFCLANTETILFDLAPPTTDIPQSADSAGRRPSGVPPACLQLCHPSVSPHLLRGFTGMMGRLVRRRSLKRRKSTPL